jgi:hypothetical protein
VTIGLRVEEKTYPVFGGKDPAEAKDITNPGEASIE